MQDATRADPKTQREQETEQETEKEIESQLVSFVEMEAAWGFCRTLDRLDPKLVGTKKKSSVAFTHNCRK